ncbi:hypothetical protein Lesp02_25960 [Lentzea sp. NBRC 105346]|uniref:hypothetical protein n=1 Tax=Lentzea sp. NBRC 105346 TaxID=3032205 RepID=UPI0025521464|nr:hypothetical protein [Lentzea sp. NBRC 105346]GLZ30407.1 hypothetical protein Lesp02_25960 [Lentzea sp. NBRC 105346]
MDAEERAPGSSQASSLLITALVNRVEMTEHAVVQQTRQNVIHTGYPRLPGLVARGS